MEMTQEQQQIVDTDLLPGQTLKVMAFAGTGKTTTLAAYTRKRPAMRFLYIAFNKSVQREASEKFPANVTARTTHALAFRAKGVPHKDRLVPGFKANQVMTALGLERYEDARFAIDTLTRYLVSADPKVSVRHIPSAAHAFYKNNRLPPPDLVALANRLGRLMCDSSHPEIGMLHDGYLKLYQLSGPVLDVDCILLDEAQDINPVTAAFVFAQVRPDARGRKPAALILVGDNHQQIYSFRGARDSLKSFPAEKTRYLTQSFRFDNNVARVANMVLSRFKGEQKQLRGTPVPGKAPWNPERYTIIARTNATLFEKAVALSHRFKVGFVGGASGYRLNRLKEMAYLLDRNRDRVRDPYLKSFDRFSDLFAYARTVEDFELLAQCRLVEKHGTRLPALVDRVLEKAVDESRAQVLLATAHKSKGLEWSQVLLMDDFFPLVKEGRPIDPSGVDPDEFNLVYVAMTRAMGHLRFDRASDIPEFIRYCLKHPE